jgi:hypothetical protein
MLAEETSTCTQTAHSATIHKVFMGISSPANRSATLQASSYLVALVDVWEWLSCRSDILACESPPVTEWSCSTTHSFCPTKTLPASQTTICLLT